jgi:hypothetical protein
LAFKDRQQFERFSLEAKWVFFPKILGYSGFDQGRQPFQGFTQLLKWRNELVHYKGMKEDRVYGAAPGFLAKLGLTITDAENSINSSANMIRDFSVQRGEEEPFGLRKALNEMSYFELVFSRGEATQ